MSFGLAKHWIDRQQRFCAIALAWLEKRNAPLVWGVLF
jgi:hypothetical protein